MSELTFALGALLIVVAVFVAGILVGKRVSAPDPADKAAPQYWVGISVYEGGDQDAAAKAYAQLQQQEHQLPGDREWMSGDRHVRKFKVV